MRILVGTSYRSVVGGADTYLRGLLPALASRGHEVALVYETPADPQRRTVDAEVPGVPHWLLSAPRALEQAEAWRPDVCYSQGLDNPALEAALLDRFPVVLFAHNYHGTCVSGSKRHALPQSQPCTRSLGPACLLRYYPCRCGGLNPRTLLRQYRQQRRRLDLLPRYHAILVASRHMHAEYVRHPVPATRVVLVPYPPGTARDPAPPTARAFTQRVLFAGRLTELKGGAVLIPALAEASSALGRRLHLVVAGDGPQQALLARLAQRCDVPAEFCGWVDEQQRAELMRSADLLAVPSVWPEPFGLVGLEAACVGLPAVAFAVGGIPDWLRPGVSGELAPGDPPTVHGLAAAIARALSDRERHARLRHGAWTVAGSFTQERHLADLESILGPISAGSRAVVSLAAP